MNKKTVVVLFGGQSSEHEVSCISATTIINHIDKEIYNVLPVGITKTGQWLLYEGDINKIVTNEWEQEGISAIISPDAVQKSLIVIQNNTIKKIEIDVIFPALHGLYGEDGSVQGLFELAVIPYVGCGILASSISMDKLYTKIVVERLGIRQAEFLGVFSEQLNDMRKVIEKIENKFVYPVFIKPSNAGSSVGITKAHNRQELIEGLKLAALSDRKILIEEFIKGREVECAVLGNNNVEVSGVGEIISSEEFYDYSAKYNSKQSKTILNADLPRQVVEEIREDAVNIFKAVDGSGLARVDFFVQEGTNKVIFNEINTLPGFTSISMYPMLWEQKGLTKTQLIDKLIKLALERS